MILASTEDTAAFTHLPFWSDVQAFLMRADLSSLEAGRYDIHGDDLYAIIAEEEYKEGSNSLEAHRTYLDVQVALEGSFDVLWRDLSSCIREKKAYDAENDYLLMSDEAHTRLHLVPGIAAVFYSNDAHAPQPPSTRVRKVVFKVKVP